MSVMIRKSTALCLSVCYHGNEAEYSITQWYEDKSCFSFLHKKWFSVCQTTLNNGVHYILYVANMFVSTPYSSFRYKDLEYI